MAHLGTYKNHTFEFEDAEVLLCADHRKLRGVLEYCRRTGTVVNSWSDVLPILEALTQATKEARLLFGE